MKAFDKLIPKLENVIKLLPTLLANKSERFFKASFDAKGYSDKRFKPWKKTKKGFDILTDLYNLRNAIKASPLGKRTIKVSNAMKYAEIHNSGGVINRTSSKGLKYQINMPQRQFMGDSKRLEKELEILVEREFENILKGF